MWSEIRLHWLVTLEWCDVVGVCAVKRLNRVFWIFIELRIRVESVAFPKISYLLGINE